MKLHTNDFKNGIKQFGKEIDSKITYTINNEEIELGAEQLNSITPHYEGSILKSVMKQLDIDSNVEIPLETVINYQFGLKIGNEYEYLNYGNYVVYKVEKQEDTNSYKITCYDKMLYSMIPYEAMNITYPITIRNYLSAICSKLGLTFKNASDTFANYDKEIASELYLDSDGNSLDYTFRDVLDEIAGATGSTICINEDDDELEVRYVNETNDTINEEYLKDINVKFGEKYGPVNSIVLSRSAESDNIFLRDEDSVALNGLCEIKIKDNQILNGNNRDEFLQDLLDALDGLEYYINDYSSTGITYYDLCDKYNVSIDNQTYSCVMFNDEVNVTQGLEENIYTEMPEETETDYTIATKTDRTRDRAYIIAKKQEAEIEALASKIVDVSNTITGINTITLENAYKGILHRLEIIGNLSCLFPSNNLVPSNNLTPIEIILDVDEEKYILDINYLEYVNNDDCDKFVYEDGKCWIERRNGTIEERQDLTIYVDKESTISIEYFDNIRLNCLYLLENEYTSTFANQLEVTSELNLLADTIEAKVSQVADEDGNVTSASIILAVNNDESSAEIQADKINLNGVVTANENFKILEDGSMQTKNATFSGLINGGAILITGGFTETDPYIEVEHPNSSSSAPIGTRLWSNGISCYDYSSGGMPVIRTENNDGFAQMIGSEVDAYAFNNISLEEQKKDFEQFDKALDIISNADIYKYHYKVENKKDKKHIGLVISNGKKNYNTPDEVISSNGKGIDLYAMISMSWKAIQELTKQNEKLQEEINKLKKEMNK